uniref:Uncharacterized protein n=1 Tax=Anopheles atroparvus TaxID=41427 RepID=A0A182JJ61_ANOAO
MLLQFILALSLVSVSLAQDYGSDPNYPDYPSYPDYTANTNPPAYPDYGTNPEEYPEPQYPDYTYVETVETTTVTTTIPTIRRQPTARRQAPRISTRRQAPSRPANRIVRWYILNGNGIPLRTAVARSYRTSSLPYGLPSFYRTRALGSRALRPNRAQGQQLQRRIVDWWYL